MFSSAVYLIATATLATALPAPRLRPRQTDNTTAITFADVLPSPDLDWVDCYAENFQCTSLTVPLDYANASIGITNVAFIRYVFSEDARDLMIHPGGPGESGVDYILGWGKQLGNRWEYNPVSFDPRGVQWTAPILACDYTLSEDSARLRRRQARKKNTLGDLSDIFDENLEYNELCSANNDYTAARYVGATAVVQDMMHFTELQAAQRDEDPSASLINFYGVSYGTLVGQVLVAMYPDRIRRVLLDANVYGVAHFNGYEPTSIGDYAHAIHLFCELCFEAGEDWCPLAQGANSTEAIQQRFDNALQELRDNPVADEVTGYVFDDNAFLSETYQYFYFPDSGYSKIANMTLAALKGKGAWPEPEEEESSNAPKTGPDAIHIITAVDMGGRYPWSTYESWKAATEELAATAPYGAKGFAETNGIIGLNMSIIPPESQYFPGFESITPRAPVLFVNTAADPVTPASGARQMSRLFKGSAVLVTNGHGHGYINAPSKCAYNIVKKYMKSGVVPEKETLCEPDVEASYYFGAEAEEWIYNY